jgi:hypothetical protein
MKLVKIMLVVAALAMVGTAYCQTFGNVSARQLGMGGAAVAVADDAFAWIQNPAGLPALAAAPKEGAKWSWDVAAGATFSSENKAGDNKDLLDISLSACDPVQGMGFGVGAGQDKIAGDKDKLWGAGFGIKGRSDSTRDWALGANFQHESWTGSSQTTYDVGAMYNTEIAEKMPVKVGFVVRNVGDKFDGRMYVGGVSFKASQRLLVAADLGGVGQTHRDWALGGEYRLDEWALRAGDAGGALALGAGYKWNNWCLDYAHAQKDGAKTNLVTVSTHF